MIYRLCHDIDRLPLALFFLYLRLDMSDGFIDVPMPPMEALPLGSGFFLPEQGSPQLQSGLNLGQKTYGSTLILECITDCRRNRTRAVCVEEYSE